MHQLTTPQQERLRRLVRRSPAFLGMKVEVHDDHIEVLHPEQLVLGFATLSERVADASEGQWPDIVDTYLERVIELATSRPAELSGPTEAVLERVYLRLMDSTGHEAWPDYAEEVVPGLMLVIAFDLPDAIMTLNDDDVRTHGIEQLNEAGQENLCRQLPDRFLEADGVYYLQGSDYVGSLVLVIPWVIEAVTGVADAPHGALVAMPARDQFVFHVIRDRDTAGVLAALDEVGALAADCHANSAYPLSSRVYWWRPLPVGGLETVGHHNGAGVVTYYSDDFEDVLFDVGLKWG